MRFHARETSFAATMLLVLLALAVKGTQSAGATQPAAAKATLTPKPADVRWGFYITYNPNSLVSLQANASKLNYVSPWFYYVNPAGQVTGNDQPAASTIIRKAGAKSLPMVKNDAQYNDFTAILTDTVKQDAIVTQIDAIVATNHYDGITVDFEGLNASDKPLLTAFMGKLYAKLHPEGKLVAMAVAAQVRDTNEGWAGCYDYPALALVTDYILVMAYDYHWSTGDPGPVAPMPKLRSTAAYAASKIPPSHIIFGTGVYGYDWPINDSGAATGKADYRNYAEATALTTLPNSISGYDWDDQAPYVRYTKDGLNRMVWYEDRRSFQAKLDLIAQYKMAGFGIWRLGQEDPGVWDAIQGKGTPPPVPTSKPLPPTATPRPATPTATPTPRPLVACQAIGAFASTAGRIYFAPTKHSLSGTFLQYWQQHGSLPVYGYPLTEEFIERSPTDGKQYKVQYFERNRFEFHPENQPPNDVQLGLLGVQALGSRSMPSADGFDPGPYTIYFPQVKHTLSGQFLGYWQHNGGITQLGYPISEPVLERDPTSGRTYTVQYLERARFELHPEYSNTNAEVLLGLLGLNITPCK